MKNKLPPKIHKLLKVITRLFLFLTIIATIYTLIVWVLSEPGNFEPLNVLAFALLSLLTTLSGWLSRTENVAPPENSVVADTETIPLGPLRGQIADSFSLDEINFLCMDLGIKYENLSGATVDAKAAALVAYMQRRNQLPKLMSAVQRERPEVHWSQPAQLKSQYSLRRNVYATWIKGVLENSVPDEIAIELKLTYQPHKVTRKVSYVLGQTEQEVTQPLPELLNDYGSLLILGEPGSGKTMTLLQLTDFLLATAEADPQAPTPVVLNLSSWANEQQPLEDWLIEEMLLQYQTPRAISQNWITQGQLVYMLDGLDEVDETFRTACVIAINKFQTKHASSVVVCCRMVEYENIAAKLNVGMGLCIQALTYEQVDKYLKNPQLNLVLC